MRPGSSQPPEPRASAGDPNASEPPPRFHVYILQNPSGRFYVGHTSDLAARLANHNSGRDPLGKYTRKNGPWELVWSEAHSTRPAASRREREIKSWKSARRVREVLLGLPPG